MNGREQLIAEVDRAVTFHPVEGRAEKLRYLAELFVGRAGAYSDEQVALFDDVIARLAAEIEVSARAELARALAPIPNAPPGVIRLLACDDAIEVAAPVLTLSERLDDAALIATARTKSRAHLLAISHRKSLAEAVTDVLIERGDSIVVLSTVRNAGARLSDGGLSELVRRSERDEAIAESLGERPDIPRHHFLKLLSVASERVRVKLERANPQAAAEIRRVVEEVAVKAQAKSIARSREYSRALRTVEEIAAGRKLDERPLMAFAVAGRFEETVVALSFLTGVTIAMVERAMLQERTELLLSLLKSVGCSWPTAKAVLQLRSADRMMAAAEVDECLANYERLKPKTAELVVRFHSSRSKAAS